MLPLFKVVLPVRWPILLKSLIKLKRHSVNRFRKTVVFLLPRIPVVSQIRLLNKRGKRRLRRFALHFLKLRRVKIVILSRVNRQKLIVRFSRTLLLVNCLGETRNNRRLILLFVSRMRPLRVPVQLTVWFIFQWKPVVFQSHCGNGRVRPNSRCRKSRASLNVVIVLVITQKFLASQLSSFWLMLLKWFGGSRKSRN